MSIPVRSFFAVAGTAFLVGSLALTAACGGSDKKDDSKSSSSSGGSGYSSSPAASAPVAATTAATPRPPTTVPPAAAATSAPATAAPTTAAPAPAAAAAPAVSIVDFVFQPTALTAKAGQPVTFNVSNKGNAPHTFTITGVTDSGTLTAGGSKAVQFTPAAAGTLTYFCNIHGQATMSGQLTVTP